jgi:NAD(P)-dependent dehydrogenase (short-subunit alcohol dehydrogenase family)
LADRSRARGATIYADRVVAEIRNQGGQAVARYDTVATVAGVRRIVEAALDSWGRLDAVINNAGNMRFGPFKT